MGGRTLAGSVELTRKELETVGFDEMSSERKGKLATSDVLLVQSTEVLEPDQEASVSEVYLNIL
jgi:hypothetical protein